MGFLADFEQHWRTHGRKVLDILAEKYPQAYFGGAVALAKSIKWETAEEDLSGGGMTPEEITACPLAEHYVQTRKWP